MEQREWLAMERKKAGLSFGGIFGTIGRAAGGLIPGGGAIIESLFPRGGGPCPDGQFKVGSKCVNLGAALPGGTPLITPITPQRPIVGTRGGPALPFQPARGGPSQPGGFAPEQRQTTYSNCGRGFVLGFDGLCYGKRGFPNKDRMWPRGRQPLLTGGERNAITTANRAAKKIERTTKQLQKMGMIKKPNPRRRAAARAPMRQIGPGPSIINVE